uniref:Uncharacterized protein n=1 Tax=Physcomitrium patens TaxID=3218 RepID=A0A2K1KQL4_PHYPA|nr:hypothetical protein PHYPA_006955 [Physcomitrium patens]
MPNEAPLSWAALAGCPISSRLWNCPCGVSVKALLGADIPEICRDSSPFKAAVDVCLCHF